MLACVEPGCKLLSVHISSVYASYLAGIGHPDCCVKFRDRQCARLDSRGLCWNPALL